MIPKSGRAFLYQAVYILGIWLKDATHVNLNRN